MKRIFAIIAALMLLSVCALAEPVTLTVHGAGVVAMDPDIATITLGVREASKDVSAAQNAVNAKLTAVIDRLGEMGVSPENIHTSSIYIYQDYDYSSSVNGDAQVTYVAENSISVDITDIENAGNYIDAVFQAGANTFNGISFSVSNAEDEQAQALALSVENARKKADTLAAAAGMKVTGMVSLQEDGYSTWGGNNGGDWMYAKAESTADTGATRVFADKIQISASVTIEYAMEPVE